MSERSISSVLFVCMGNICRSPLAEGMLRHAVAATGGDLQLEIDSAGTHAYHVGQPPDPRAIAAARRRGVDIRALRARIVGAEDFHRFDLIIAMDRDNLVLLRERQRGGRAQLALFMGYAGEADADVPDPYYGDDNAFEHALDLIESGVAALLEQLRPTR